MAVIFCHVFLFRAFIIVMIAGTSKKHTVETMNNVSGSKGSNDGELMAEARRDPAAFVRLYRRHYDAVFRYCVHRLFERHAAEDVTSAVFLKVVQNMGRFEGSQEQFRNWLYRIATNAVNEHLRRTARREGILMAFAEQTRGEVFEDIPPVEGPAEKLVLLKRAMLMLKPRYQTIITLRFFENLKLTEIAEVLGSSDGTVRSQLARALAKLRKRIASQQKEVQK